MVVRFILLFFLALPFGYAVPRLSTEVTPRSGTLDDSYTFIVRITDADDSVSLPSLRGGKDFDLSLVGPRQSVVIDGATVKRTLSYEYRLLPRREGKLSTPAAEISVRGETQRADGIEVVVMKAPPKNADEREDAFVRQSVYPAKVFRGEQLVDTVELFSKVRVAEPQALNLTFDGFLQESFGPGESGQRYFRGELHHTLSISRALYPIKTGTIKLEPRKLRVKVLGARKKNSFPQMDPFGGSIFDDFFDTVEFKDVELQSNESEVEVRELPPVPSTSAFWSSTIPIVGETSLQVRTDRSAIKVGEGLPIELEVRSVGNLNGLTKLPVDTNGTPYRIYSETPSQELAITSGKIMMIKKLQFTFVPYAPGNYEVRLPSILVFDPQTEKYSEKTPDPVIVDVTGTAVPTPIPLTKVSGDVAQPEEINSDVQAATDSPLEIPWVKIAKGVTLFLVFAGVLGLLMDVVRKLFHRRRLKRSVIVARDAGELYSVIRTAVGFDEHQSGEALKSQVGRSMSAEKAAPYLVLLDEFDKYLYGGQVLSKEQLKALKERALEILL